MVEDWGVDWACGVCAALLQYTEQQWWVFKFTDVIFYKS